MTVSRRSLPDCPPRWATPRDLSRPTLGPRVAETARLLGKPFMPWQRLIVDVALEIDPQTGQLWYREVDTTVPRQSGKTTLELGVMVHRALGFSLPQVITYTAQSRIKAREKWEDEHIPILDKSPLHGFYRVRKTTGNEAILWRNGSKHAIEATTEKAGHGPTLDLGVIDEAFAHTDSRVEQAMKPAMITRPSAQLHVLSTAGTIKSVYLRGKVNAGRLRCEAGIRSRTAYFDWSAPDTADPADPATWRACMPALGIMRADGTGVSEETIQSEFDTWTLADFRRAYLNQWLDAFPEEWLVISQSGWRSLADPLSRVLDPVAFAVDMTPERDAVSIAIAGSRPDGLLHVELVQPRPSVDNVVARVVELAARWEPCAVVIDPAAGNPAASLITDIEDAGVEVLKPGAREVVQACGQFYDAVTEGNLRHMGQDDLDRSVAAAAQRQLGDAWAWGRRHAQGDISGLCAVTFAAWGHAVKAPLSDVGAWRI